MCEEYNNKLIKIYKSFINDLVNVYPEQKTNIYNVYQVELINDDYNIEDTKFNNICHLLIDKYDLLINNNENIFNERILENVDFNKLWKSNITPKTRHSIWNYLQSMALVYLSYNISKELNCPLSQIKGKKLTSSQLDKIKKIKGLSVKIKEAAPNVTNDPQLSKIFNMTKTFENTNIGNIAKNITQDLDINNLIGNNSNPMELLQDPSKFMNMFNGLDKKIESQVKHGNYKN